MVRKKGKVTKSTIKKKDFTSRPPVVTVLGHIDHGKTTLLDFIRKENVAQKEAGGITQHVGAYQAKVKIDKEEKWITFIDTPGHEAFSKMRSQGAEVADFALLVISAKDGVMPQTKESITYIKKAKIPMIIAINKIDLFDNKAEKEVMIKKIEKQLKKLNVVVEKEGGETVSLPISAKTGENVKDLLEMIILLSEMKGLKGKVGASLKGVVIDSKVDRRKGVLATVLVREGNLEVGDRIKIEEIGGKVRALFDEYGKTVKKAGSSKPVQVLGFEKAPPIGGIVRSEEAKEEKKPRKVVLEVLKTSTSFGREEGTEEGKLRIILKTDTLGTEEAVSIALRDKVEVISSGIGDVSESDVFLAKTSQVPILGFNVGVLPEIRRLAQNEGVKIKIYKVIYKLLDEVEDAVEFIREEEKEKVLGKGKIISQFEIKKKRIAGVKVLEGRIARGDRIKILRGEEKVGEGRIRSLRHRKEDIPKAQIGEECGVGFSKQLDFRVGDVVKSIG